MKKWAHTLIHMKDTGRNTLILHEDGYIHHIRQPLEDLMENRGHIALDGAELVDSAIVFHLLVEKHGDPFHTAGVDRYLRKVLDEYLCDPDFEYDDDGDDNDE